MTAATAASSSKALNKKELKKFQELLEEKRKAVLERAREMLSIENMSLDTNDLPDEMDLASSEYLQSFEFRLRGREKSLLSKLDLALKKIEDTKALDKEAETELTSAITAFKKSFA